MYGIKYIKTNQVRKWIKHLSNVEFLNFYWNYSSIKQSQGYIYLFNRKKYEIIIIMLLTTYKTRKPALKS